MSERAGIEKGKLSRSTSLQSSEAFTFNMVSDFSGNRRDTTTHSIEEKGVVTPGRSAHDTRKELRRRSRTGSPIDSSPEPPPSSNPGTPSARSLGWGCFEQEITGQPGDDGMRCCNAIILEFMSLVLLNAVRLKGALNYYRKTRSLRGKS